MPLKVQYFIITVIFANALFCQPFYKKRDTKFNRLSYSQDSLPKIDSMKWVMYAMNHYKKAIHFKFHNLPELSILECDVKFMGIDNSRKDTIIYNFFFCKGDETNVYIPNTFYFSGIGYSYKTRNSFPMLSHAYPTFAENTDTCKLFFEQREKDFINYLKNYTGNLSIWLGQEAIRRKVIKK